MQNVRSSIDEPGCEIWRGSEQGAKKQQGMACGSSSFVTWQEEPEGVAGKKKKKYTVSSEFKVSKGQNLLVN